MGSASVPNVFQNTTGPDPLSNLDANFTALVNYANDPTNRSNTSADTGAANAYVLTPSPPLTAYTAGQIVVFLPAHANTGASTINISGKGVVALYKGNSAALVANDLLTTVEAVGICDGTNVMLLNPQTIAASTATVAVAGEARNLKIVRASTTTLTVTYDQVIEATALSGTLYLSASGNFTLNGATTGANGMDTGAIPASGFVGIYAITKGDGATFAVLGVNAATNGTPTIYPGANMPSGYTASGLIGIWPTNGSSQFPVAYQIARRFLYDAPAAVVTGATVPTSMTSQSISGVAPVSSKTASILWLKTALGPIIGTVAGSANGAGAKYYNSNSPGSFTLLGIGTTGAAPFPDIPLITAQTVYWQDARNDASVSNMYITDFTF